MNMDAQLALARHQKAVAELETQKMEKLLHLKEVQLAKVTLSFRQEVNRLQGKLMGYGWVGQIRNELVPYINPTSNDDPNATADPQLQAEIIQDLRKELASLRELSGFAGMMLGGIAEHLEVASEELSNSSWRLVKTSERGWEFKKVDLAETDELSQSISTAITARTIGMGPTSPSSKSSPGEEPRRKIEKVQESPLLPSTSATAFFFPRKTQSDADDDDEEEKPLNYSTRVDIDEDDGPLSTHSSSSESFSLISQTSSGSPAWVPATSSLTSTKKQSVVARMPSLPNAGANCEAKVKIEGEVRQKVFQQSSLVASSASTTFSQTKTNTASISLPPAAPSPPKHGVANVANLLCLCGRKFTKKQGLTYHINYCNGPKPGNLKNHKCGICGGPFPNEGLLAIHMTRNHGQASGGRQTRIVRKRLSDSQARRFKINFRFLKI